MIKRCAGIAVTFAIIVLLLADADPTSYGVLYIENKTDYPMRITANVVDDAIITLTNWEITPHAAEKKTKDARINTATVWEIEPHRAEKIDNIHVLSDIRYRPVLEDDEKAENWLKQEHAISIDKHESAKDLIVTISKDPYGNRWRLDQAFVSSAKLEYGQGPGHYVQVILR